MKLYEKISNIRTDNDLTQEELAEMLFVSRQSVSNWETGKCYPDLETILLISDKFEVSLDVLLKEDMEMIKNIDNTVKKFRRSKIFWLLTMIVIIIGCLTIWLSYKLLLVNYYEEDDTEFIKEVLGMAENMDVEYDKESANYQFGTLSLRLPQDVVRNEDDEHLQERIFEKDGVRSVWMSVDSSSHIEIYHTEKNYANLKFSYDSLMRFDINDNLDLVSYFEEHMDDKPTVFWSREKIQMQSLAINYVRSLTLRGTADDKPYFVKIYDGDDVNSEGVIYINEDFWVISLYSGDWSFYIRLNRDHYDIEDIKAILESCKIENV